MFKKFLKPALLIISLTLMCGCGKANQSKDTDITISDTQLVTLETSTNDQTSDQNESTLTPQATKPSVPLSLETPGGAVLVGTVKKDSKGWYFTPEQTINLKLTYYPEHPETFNNITRIEMLPNIEDGFDKTIYEKQTVTIAGNITNPRSAGTLYFVPYRIESGKTITEGYAAPDLKPISYDNISFDKDKLLNKQKPVIKNGTYTYNPYMLSNETLNTYGNGFANFYAAFVDAYINYKTSVSCPNKNYADYLSTVLIYEFPMFDIDASYSTYTWYNATNKTISWKYTKTKTDHNQIINTVTTAANNFLNGVKSTDTEKSKAQKIYNNFNANMKYDYKAMNTRNNTEAYYAYATNSGVCVTFAIAYSQLLTQVGIESTVASGITSNNDTHLWNVITIGGANYFADPTYEITSAKANKYFGMSLNDRLNDGSGFKSDEISIGRYNVYGVKSAGISSSTLK